MSSRNPYVYARPFSIDEDGDMPRVDVAQTGITLRDEAALRAFAAIIGNMNSPAAPEAMKAGIAQLAYQYADAFIKERNRPEDEAEARRQAEVKAARERIQNARYFIGADHHVQIGTGVVELEYVWDRTEKTVVAARNRALNDYEAPGEEDWRPINLGQALPASVLNIASRMENLEKNIEREKPWDLEEWGFEGANELPDWAQPQ